MEDDIEITDEIVKARKRIEEKMNELKVMDYGTLLIFASVVSLELQDKGANWSFPNGFDYNKYAAKMLIKGAELSKIYYSKKASEKSHEETNQFKSEILKDYKTNKSKLGSKDEAASYYKKLYPLAFSTIRRYLKNQ